MILQEYEEVWKQMREASAREIARRQKGIAGFGVGDHVFVYVPKLLRGKLDVKWSGPFPVQEKVTETTWKVNGKVEHQFNLKRASVDEVREPAPIEERTNGDVDQHAARIPKRGRGDDISAQGKKQRLRCLLACAPRGELLWL
jgi:hypothetical protein